MTETLADGRFRAIIHRVWQSPSERQLIITAERLYPSPETIVGAVHGSGERHRLQLLRSGVLDATRNRPSPRAAGAPADRWWFDEFDNTWTPYAVTGAAIDYYLGRIRDIAAGRGEFVYARGQPKDHGAFEYTAIVRRDSDDGRVVELRLRWSYWCGFLCAISFTQSRTVSFDRNGAVVQITGDDRPLVIVS